MYSHSGYNDLQIVLIPTHSCPVHKSSLDGLKANGISAL